MRHLLSVKIFTRGDSIRWLAGEQQVFGHQFSRPRDPEPI